MMVRFQVVAVMVALGVFLVGCVSQSSSLPEPRDTTATPEVTHGGAASGRPAGWAGSAGIVEGLVTDSYMAGDEHWILVEREPVCHTPRQARRGPCPGMELEISGATVVRRGPGVGVQPAPHSGVQMDQRVRASHGATEIGPYYPYGEADKIVILLPG